MLARDEKIVILIIFQWKQAAFFDSMMEIWGKKTTMTMAITKMKKQLVVRQDLVAAATVGSTIESLRNKNQVLLKIPFHRSLSIYLYSHFCNYY